MKKFFRQFKKNERGFAMLFTVLIISVILAIGLGISDVTYKQTILSNLAKDSQLAFYQADSGVECGMYYDLTAGQFPKDVTIDVVPQVLACGNDMLPLDLSQSSSNIFVYKENPSNANAACYSVAIDKSDAVKTVISSRGFSTCNTTPEQVERALNVTY